MKPFYYGILFVLFAGSSWAQYRGVVTSKDHPSGNQLSTLASAVSISESGEIFYTQTPGEILARENLLNKGVNDEPISRSYYLWAEKTGPTPFTGNINQVLLSAITVNGYEDVVDIEVKGPKAGVLGTRWDLPMELKLRYNLSTGNTPAYDGSAAPTTATSYTRSGSVSGFDSTDDPIPSIGFSYKTANEGAPEDNWIGPFEVIKKGETKFSLVPSELPSGISSYNQNSQWSIKFALQMSSIREVARLESFTVYPFPQVLSGLARNLGKKKRDGETVPNLPTKYYEYDFEGDPVSFPDLNVEATKGFPMTQWELVHVKPDGSKTTLETLTGTNPSAAIDFPSKMIKLSRLLKEEGTHYIRLYNRFENPTVVPEESELSLEWRFNTWHITRVRAHIHEYGGDLKSN